MRQSKEMLARNLAHSHPFPYLNGDFLDYEILDLHSETSYHSEFQYMARLDVFQRRNSGFLGMDLLVDD